MINVSKNSNQTPAAASSNMDVSPWSRLCPRSPGVYSSSGQEQTTHSIQSQQADPSPEGLLHRREFKDMHGETCLRLADMDNMEINTVDN